MILSAPAKPGPSSVCPLLDGAEQAAEVGAELAQRGPSGRNTRRGSECSTPAASRMGLTTSGARRMAGADLILEDALRHRAPELLGQQRRRILVERAELVLAAVGALESQRLGLLAAARARVGRSPPANCSRSSTGTRIGVVHRSR